jgi:SAM-dependent methyltransferase
VLHLLTKKQLWGISREAAIQRLEPEQNWQLRSAQDAMALELIGDVTGKRIAEIGGKGSKVLPLLGEAAERISIEPASDKSTPASDGQDPGAVRTIHGDVGRPMDWPSGYFDVLYSVSFVENVTLANLPAFFEDCHRLLKTGGTMIHLIAAYLEDEPPANASHVARTRAMIEGLKGFKPLGSVMTADDVAFSCSLVTNPDNVMAAWNRISPNFTTVRERAQCCTFVMAAKKPWF